MYKLRGFRSIFVFKYATYTSKIRCAYIILNRFTEIFIAISLNCCCNSGKGEAGSIGVLFVT